MNPWLGILLVLGSLAGLMLGCRRLGKRHNLSSELERKIVHIGMGLICTSFPLLFSVSWPVYLLGGLAITTLAIVRTSPALRSSVGSSLHRVERTSLGEIYFPLAVVVVWFFSAMQPLFYSLSILVLTLADAFAALVGTRYGQKHYTTKEGYKTWEGSFIFFTVTFLCIHIPLLLHTEIGRPESVLVALLIGILVMIIEAIAWRGLDNLFIPLCVCIFLNVYWELNSWEIMARIGIISIAIVALFVVRSRSKLDDASLLGAGLVAYLLLAIGGWQWGVAPLIFFINYLILGPEKTTPEERDHNIYALLAVSIPGFVWLLFFSSNKNAAVLIYYNTAYMAELICIYIAQWAFDFPKKSLLYISLKGAVLGYCFILLPFFLFNPQWISWEALSTTFLAAIVSGQLFRFLQPQIRDCPPTRDRFFRQGAIGLFCSAIPWILLKII